MKHSAALAILMLMASHTACAQTPVVDGAADTPEVEYAASAVGQVYYWIGCDNWRSIPDANLRWFSSSAEAEAAGYRPSTARGCAGPERRAGPGPLETGVCTIERVVDGDTVACREAAERIRLLLVDAPELSQGEYGRAAHEALQRLLPIGTAARVEVDVQPRDRYGRILAYLHADDVMVNEELARSGYVVVSVHPPNVRHVDRLRSAVEQARLAERGLWSSGAFECSPEDHRRGRCG